MTNGQAETGWKSRTYMTGAIAGAVVGFLSAYLFARAAEENRPAENTAKPVRVGTGELITVGLVALGVIRQIAEMGRAPEQKKK